MKALIQNTVKVFKNRGYTGFKKSGVESQRAFIRAKKADKETIILCMKYETLGVALIRDAIKELDKNKKIKHKVIVGAGKVTRSAKNEMIANNIEFIPAQLVMMDILDHEFVPKHEIISEEEANKILNYYKLTKEDLPQILTSDPVAIIIGARPGDVIRITRKSQTAGESIIYRQCIQAEE
ncbi:MAG: DNA-directed RNA polymerase subunit H [Candidatus Helarchaeota archaeon]